ncbi:MAG: pentapeptide repeat-containing protein, partial [Actinomycetota bacterium]
MVKLSARQQVVAIALLATVGVGAWFSAVDAAPVRPPTAPRLISAASAAGSALISWVPPVSNGGAPVTSYQATASPGGRVCTTSGALTCQINGLTNGTRYSIAVRARNRAGLSPAGTPQPSVVPHLTRPSAPTNVTARPGDRSVVVKWGAPVIGGGTPISGYTVSTVPRGGGCSSLGELTCTVVGLTNGVPVSFTVIATNGTGSSIAAMSKVVTPSAIPTAPTNVVAVPLNTKATISWTRPTSLGGGVLIGYTVTSSPGSGTCTTTTTLSCTISGLTNGTTYIFSVVARTAVGSSPPGVSPGVSFGATVGGIFVYPGANLTGLNFTGLDFGTVDLTGAIFTGTHLGGANLSHVTLTGVASGSIIGDPDALPSQWKLVNGYLVGQGANLSGANLTSQNLAGVKLTGADLNNAKFASSNFLNVSSGGIIGRPASLPTDWQLLGGYLIGPGADLTGATLTNASLTNANLANVNFTNTNLTGAQLSGAGIVNANLTGTILTSTNLTNAHFAGSTLASIVSGGITGTPTLPTGWHVVARYLVGPTANLTGANFTSVNFASLDLTNVRLNNAILTGATMTGVNLTGADLTGATLTGAISGHIIGTPRAMPTGWKVVIGSFLGPNVDLSNADLTAADLSNVSLQGVRLTGATLLGVSSGGITGTPVNLPTNCRLVGGYLIGPGANLTGASLV